MDFNAYLNRINAEQNIPFTVFIVSFLLLAFLETRFEDYKEKNPPLLRWPSHFLLALINALFFRFVLPGFALSAAMSAYGMNFGLFNQCKVPDLFAIIFTIVFLDWMVYYLHRAYHAVPWMWKIHRVHHTDIEVDVTTGLRFHTLEVVMTTFVKVAVIYLLGAPVYGVFIYEMVYGLSLLFDHSNIHIPQRVEKILRYLMITPFMHRVHHSANSKQTNSNYGFIFSLWDRFLGTYQDPAKAAPAKLGLDLFNTKRFLRIRALLAQPFYDDHGSFKWKNITRED